MELWASRDYHVERCGYPDRKDVTLWDAEPHRRTHVHTLGCIIWETASEYCEKGMALRRFADIEPWRVHPRQTCEGVIWNFG